MNYTITGFTPELIPGIDSLLDAYRKVYLKAVLPPAISYLAPWTEHGKNVICAIDETGTVCGFAPVLLSDISDKPYTFWTAIRVNPEHTSPAEVQDALLDRIQERASEIVRTLPPRKCRLAFQYNLSETQNINHVISRGGTYSESNFLMRCDLSQDVPVLALPAGVDIRYSTMSNEAEQQAWLTVCNQSFEGRPYEFTVSSMSMTDFQNLLDNVYRPDGTFILAYHGQQLIGSVTVYWIEYANSEMGVKTGITDYVFTDEDWRRQGIGSYLVCEGLKFFREHGFEYAQLEVNSANRRALNLYERVGYSLVEESPFYVLYLD
ncbi:MAG: GNAT family N-acetyltransferase [Dehalococcoidales bacterium]|nr:GNAT family N-acetyltransferase [Dehalococcoidales bacterium]